MVRVPVGIGVMGPNVFFLEEFETSLQTLILALSFSFLDIAKAFLLAAEKMKAIRDQTSPRKSYVFLTTFLAFCSVTSQVHQCLLPAQMGQLQAGMLGSTLDGGQAPHLRTSPLCGLVPLSVHRVAGWRAVRSLPAFSFWVGM